MPSLAGLDAVEIATGYRAGRFSPVDVVEDCLAVIARLDGDLKAFLTVADDARQQAERADAALRSGVDLPLLGLPVALKDLIVTAGLRTTFGSGLYADHVPDQDDSVAARVRAAGAIIIGKTNTPAFGYGAITDNDLLGPTANPFDKMRTSGGSSGGSAVAVAAGMVPLAVGTDFGGSVRLPASFCGIVGFRPTIGTIPQVPRASLWASLSAIGTFGRSVQDAALLAGAMAGPDPRDPVSQRVRGWEAVDFAAQPQRRFRLAASATLGFASIDSSVEAVFWQAIDRLRPDHDVIETHPPLPPAFQQAYETIRGATLHEQFDHLIQQQGPRLSETLKWNVSRGQQTTAFDLLRAERLRMAVYADCLAFLDTVDCIATLAAPIAAFPNAQREVTEINGRKLRNIIDYSAIYLLGTMTGFPCLSIPCGVTPDGLPVGLQLITAPDRQADLLRLAHQLERRSGFAYKRPAGIDAG